MKPRILISDKLHEDAVALAREFADVDVEIGLTPEMLIQKIKGYDAIIVRSSTKVTKEVIDASTLKIIGRAGVGLDNVDVTAARARGIEIVNSPESSTVSVAEHAIGLMIATLRNVPQADKSMRAGQWDRKKFSGNELYGKILGLIGFGRIGREVALRAKAFGMKILASDPAITSEDAKEFGAEFVALEELLRRSDVVSLHVPATDATRGMMNAERLKLMKPTAVVINTARGVVIDEAALYDALKNGTIKAAGLDVYAKEPPVDSPLMQLENIVLTPHLASGTSEAQKSAGTVVVEKVGKFFEQKPPGEEHKLHWFKSSATQ